MGVGLCWGIFSKCVILVIISFVPTLHIFRPKVSISLV